MLSSPLSGNDWPEPTAEALLTRVPLPENCPPDWNSPRQRKEP